MNCSSIRSRVQRCHPSRLHVTFCTVECWVMPRRGCQGAEAAHRLLVWVVLQADPCSWSTPRSRPWCSAISLKRFHVVSDGKCPRRWLSACRATWVAFLRARRGLAMVLRLFVVDAVSLLAFFALSTCRAVICLMVCCGSWLGGCRYSRRPLTWPRRTSATATGVDAGWQR